MSQYDSFFRSKGKGAGCVLLAITHDPYYDLPLYIYYIGEDTNVGVVTGDGMNVAVAPTGTSLFMFPKDGLAGLIARVKAGEKLDVVAPAPARRKLVDAVHSTGHIDHSPETRTEPPVIQRKVLLKRREVTHG